jgi:3-hydroxyisobutyrate dehydrogenase-like beta-hydroxyacid dehydrogenase
MRTGTRSGLKASIGNIAANAPRITPTALPERTTTRRGSPACVGIVGLGRIGQVFAANLLSNGYQIIVWDRDPQLARPLRLDNARATARLDDLAPCDVVVSSLPDDDALASVVCSSDGLASVLASSAVHVSTSTVSPALSRRLASFHAAHGQGFVAAPVLESPDFAGTQPLLVLVSGQWDAIERTRPVLERLGQRIFVIGDDAGAANSMKLAANILTAAALESMGEVFARLSNAWIDPHLSVNIRTGSMFDGRIRRNYGGKIEQFGRFRLISHRRELLADGTPVPIGGRALDILIVLVGARGQLVTKDELMSRVWRDSVVGENALQFQISELRKALGPDRDLIKTISGRGYRFIAEITTFSEPEKVPSDPGAAWAPSMQDLWRQDR